MTDYTQGDAKPRPRCQVKGCRAWPKRGEIFCSSHLRSGALRRMRGLLEPLLQAITSRPDIADLEKEGLDPRQSLQLINNEIDDLRRARQIFLAWVDGLRDKLPTAAPESISPAQFLRAWNDSSSRLARLIEARLRLSKQQGSVSGEAEAVLEAAYRLIEEEDRHLQNLDC